MGAPNQVIIGQRIKLDGGDFTNAVFRRCTLTYAGGSVHLEGAEFDNCSLELDGAARGVAEVYQAMHASLFKAGYRKLSIGADGGTAADPVRFA